MTLVHQALTAFSVIVFLYFGTSCLFADGMKADFERFGMSRLRILTGVLEVMGAVGLVVGQFVPELVIVSASGLALLMMMGLITRIRVRDPLHEMLPAGVLLVVNAFLAWQALVFGDHRWGIAMYAMIDASTSA